ncbi:MAG: SHD1 domain-containing protein [Verrucomicrobiales bacterium]|nr:SHD1 domain-containing protein [Verrucomicrobiales bacterium]
MLFRRVTIPLSLLALLLIPCLLLIALKAMSGSWGGKQPFRVWTDNTGQFSAKARLKTDKGHAIVLERKDGRLVTVPLRRLSEADRYFLTKAEDEEELFRLSFWKWNFSDPADLWAILVKSTPLWLSVVIPLVIAAIAIVFQRWRLEEF